MVTALPADPVGCKRAGHVRDEGAISFAPLTHNPEENWFSSSSKSIRLLFKGSASSLLTSVVGTDMTEMGRGEMFQHPSPLGMLGIILWFKSKFCLPGDMRGGGGDRVKGPQAWID